MSVRALLLKTGSIDVEEIQTDGSLSDLQSLVDGYIECPFISEQLYNHGISVCINEEGKLRELPVSMIIVDENRRMLDVVCGNVVFANHTINGQLCDLTDEQVGFVRNLLSDFATSPDSGLAVLLPYR